jgi:UDP-N-acetylglucosamine--N-acetylmuramyl-(pentapeptide) pyrophosphoryl-undecaprenol N-acetylglucosamine transferase
MFLAAPALLAQFPDWRILHQAGAGEYERLKGLPREDRHHLVPFIDDMAEALEASSFVVCRAGASTCAELKAAGRGALMIPLPNSAGDHQRRNAEAMGRENRVVVSMQQPNLHDFIEAHCASHMATPYARIKLGKNPVPNEAVVRCLADLEATLGSPLTPP